MKKSIITKISISVFSLLFFLLLLELGLRAAGYFYTKKVLSGPAVSGRAGGGRTILCVGDSYTVGGAVAWKDTYPSQLREMVSKNPANKFNIINAGVCEANSAQTLRRLLSLINIYKPDYVILLVGSANRFNLVGYNLYEKGRRDIISDLRIYKMFRILKANLKERFLKWKLTGVDTPKIKKSLPSPRPDRGKEPAPAADELELELKPGNRPDYREIEKAYKNSLKLNPKDYKTYVDLAICFRDQQRYNLAREMCEKAIGFNPKYYRAYVELGNCYRYEGKDFRKAELFYEKAIALDPNQAWAYLELGNCYRWQGNYSRAERTYKKAIQLNPEEDKAYIELGLCYREQEKYAPAEGFYKEAIELNPQSYRAYVELANCYREQENFKPAEALYKKAIALDPGQGWAYLELGTCYRDQADFREAEGMYKKAIALDPLSRNAYINLRDCYLQEARFPEAEAVSKKTVELYPDQGWAYLELGNCYQEWKKYSQARQAYKKALELNPEETDAYVELGFCCRIEGRDKEAEQFFKKAIELNPNQGLAYGELGEFYISLGRYASALETLAKAIEFVPTDFILYYFMTRAYELQSKYDSDYILGVLEKILKNHPDLRENRTFTNYLVFFSDRENWEKKIDSWLRDDLEEIVKLCRENNISLIIQNYPYPYFSANRSLREAALSHSLPFVDNYSVFDKLTAAQERERYFVDYDHCTPEGHRVMAENIYHLLLAEGIIRDE